MSDCAEQDDTPYRRALKATKRFIFSYEFDGTKWSAEIWASCCEEAEMKIKAMGHGKVDGICRGQIQAEDTDI